MIIFLNWLRKPNKLAMNGIGSQENQCLVNL